MQHALYYTLVLTRLEILVGTLSEYHRLASLRAPSASPANSWRHRSRETRSCRHPLHRNSHGEFFWGTVVAKAGTGAGAGVTIVVSATVVASRDGDPAETASSRDTLDDAAVSYVENHSASCIRLVGSKWQQGLRSPDVGRADAGTWQVKRAEGAENLLLGGLSLPDS